ncbi:hypothetical protein DFQ28_008138 [Apophysomyces sp. BC1034]|nr:hypothetical protein DFQ30_007858 [Apophysomyces sp. BC1015]KAG0175902.1 hypothetical protein DFQ29_006814 [Apophysomyces sp. BC1021]KAG0186239.1 hypothetical protein DFQ28_008138 [Apophysomyces sp. BC1034]
MAQVRLYDLHFPDDPRGVWSPNTCKTRYALNVKGIPYESEFLTLYEVPTEIPKITKTGERPTVPVIVDLAHDNKPVQESWEIAKYLEKAYPDSSSLFHGNEGAHLFFHSYCNTQILPPLFQLVVLDVLRRSGPESYQKFFRAHHEARVGLTLEQFAGNPDDILKKFPKLLEPCITVLLSYPFLTGEKVGWADVTLAATLTVLDAIKPELFKSHILSGYTNSDSLRNWWQRMEIYRGEAPPNASPRL